MRKVVLDSGMYHECSFTLSHLSKGGRGRKDREITILMQKNGCFEKSDLELEDIMKYCSLASEDLTDFCTQV